MELNDSIGAVAQPSPNEMRCSLPLAFMRFFGKKPHETTLEFANELKALTPKDKADFRAMFEGIGFTIT